MTRSICVISAASVMFGPDAPTQDQLNSEFILAQILGTGYARRLRPLRGDLSREEIQMITSQLLEKNLSAAVLADNPSFNDRGQATLRSVDKDGCVLSGVNGWLENTFSGKCHFVFEDNANWHLVRW